MRLRLAHLHLRRVAPRLLFALGAVGVPLLLCLFSVRTGVVTAMALVLVSAVAVCLRHRGLVPTFLLALLLLEDLLFLILAVSTPWAGRLIVSADVQMPTALQVSGTLRAAAEPDEAGLAELGFGAPIGFLPGSGVVRVVGHVVFGRLETYASDELRIASALCSFTSREMLDAALQVWVEPAACFKAVPAQQSPKLVTEEMVWPTCAYGWPRDSLVAAAVGSGDIQAVILAEMPAALLPSDSTWSWQALEPAGAAFAWKIANINASADRLPYASKQIIASPLQGILPVRVSLDAPSEPITSKLVLPGRSTLILGVSGSLVAPDGAILELPRPFWALVESEGEMSLALGPVDTVGFTYLLPKCTAGTYHLTVRTKPSDQGVAHSTLSAAVSGGGNIRYGSSSFALIPRDYVYFGMPGEYALQYGGCPMSFTYSGATQGATLNDASIGPATLWHTLPAPAQVALQTSLAPLLVAVLVACGAWMRTKRADMPDRRPEEDSQRSFRPSGDDSLS